MKIIELSAIALVTTLVLLAPGLALARTKIHPPFLPTEPFPPPPNYDVKTSVNQYPGVPYTPPGFWHPPHHHPLPKHDAKISVNHRVPPSPKQGAKMSTNQYPGVPYTPPAFWHPPHHPPLPKHDAKGSVNQLPYLPFPPQELWLMRPPPPKQVAKITTNQYPGVPYTPPGFWHPPPAPK